MTGTFDGVAGRRPVQNSARSGRPARGKISKARCTIAWQRTSLTSVL